MGCTLILNRCSLSCDICSLLRPAIVLNLMRTAKNNNQLLICCDHAHFAEQTGHTWKIPILALQQSLGKM